MSDENPDRLPVLFCPVCCTPDDAPKWGQNVEMECGACGTTYAVDLIPAIVASHSIS